MTSRIKLILTAQVHDYTARLHPEHRRAVKAALGALAKGRGEVAPLEDELTGLWRLRVGRYRIVFRYPEPGVARCFFMEERRFVYDVLRARPDLWM